MDQSEPTKDSAPLSIEIPHGTQNGIITPVSPAPDYIDQQKLEEDIQGILATQPKMLPPSKNSKEVREAKAISCLNRCMATMCEYASKWKRAKGRKETNDIRGVIEGAIGAGKTTFSKNFAACLKDRFKVHLHEEKVPPQLLQAYYKKRAEMDSANPTHIPEAAQIQYYIMANRVAQFAQWGGESDKTPIHLQDRFFGDIHFMIENIRDGIVTDEEIETYIPLWSGVCAALNPPDFVVVLEPPGETIVHNSRTRMDNLRKTATKILGMLCAAKGSLADLATSPLGAELAMQVMEKFHDVVAPWNTGGDWTKLVCGAVKLRDRNGENTLSTEWLYRHAVDYLKTMRLIEDNIGGFIQFIHVPYTEKKYPDAESVKVGITALRAFM